MALAEELVRFVREALARGRSRTEVADALEQAGWGRDQVHRALDAFAPIDFPVPVPRPRPSLSARQAFTYLLLFSTLYFGAYHLGSLVFQFVDWARPDPATSVTAEYVRDSIRFSVSALVVTMPLFLYMSMLTNRELAADPNQRTSPVRRWLTYLTLFIAACVLIGDVTTLVYSLLGGELTTRFVLKVVTVAVIAGTSFWYYLSALRRDEQRIQA
jgi:hypothetical protein